MTQAMADWFESTDVIGCGMHYLHRVGPWVYPRAYHTHLWELWATTHGDTSFNIGRRQVVVPIGHCLLIPPGRIHQQHVAAGDVSLGLTVHFLVSRHEGAVRRLAGKVLEVPSLGRRLLQQMVDLPPADELAKARWRSLFAMMLNELVHPAASAGQGVRWKQSLPMTVPDGSDWALAHHVIEFLKDHLHRPADCMERLCRHLGYSQPHLNKLFRQETGISLLEALQRLRLEEAARLLRSSSLKVQAIALQLGFSQPHKFNAFFKQRMNCTPTAFLQRCKNPGWALSENMKHSLIDEVYLNKRPRHRGK